MNRESFLNKFLGALGAYIIEIKKTDLAYISGIAHYHPDEADPEDPDEPNYQEFCWHMSEKDIPRHEVEKLSALLYKYNLLNIDKIKINRESLRKKYASEYSSYPSEEEFVEILEELEAVVVNMVDDGKETDIFFIHE